MVLAHNWRQADVGLPKRIAQPWPAALPWLSAYKPISPCAEARVRHEQPRMFAGELRQFCGRAERHAWPVSDSDHMGRPGPVRGEPGRAGGPLPICSSSIAQTVSQHCPGSWSKRISPYVLRHTCAMIVLQATTGVGKVSLWLGHANLTITEIHIALIHPKLVRDSRRGPPIRMVFSVDRWLRLPKPWLPTPSLRAR